MKPSDSDSEREVVDAVNAVRAGNRQAYRTIVVRFQGTLMNLCAAITRDRQAAEELAQDVFVRAYQRLDTFDEQRPMKPWLAKIACRLAQQRWREKARDVTRQKEMAETLLKQSCGGSKQVDSLIFREQSDLLWQLVDKLPRGQRTAVVLYYREDLTIKEVAGVMGTSPGSVKTHLFRARNQMRDSLQAKGLDKGDIP